MKSKENNAACERNIEARKKRDVKQARTEGLREKYGQRSLSILIEGFNLDNVHSA